MTRTNQPPKYLRPLTPDDRLRHISYAFQHTSAPLGWNGLRVEYNTPQPASDFVHPPLACLMVVLTGKIFPERTDHRCDNERYTGDGLPQAVNLLPPGIESQWRWRYTGDFTDSTHYQLSPALIAKVAEEAFDLDPARIQFPVRYYDQSSPEVIDTLTALRHELVTGGPGGRLCAESLANVLVVQLIRQMSNWPGSGEGIRGAGGRLPRHTLQAVEEYIHAHLDRNISLADLAGVAHLSEFHFALLFKQTTGLPPYQFVIHQRVERAKQLIAAGQLSLVQIAIEVGFSDQSQLTRHF
ncbi:MAG: helix-turn-helix domain-containing protein, partial [Rhodopirellula sp. JB044]|uniref:helix-turn-helix domain-containing protein n=1 Tax=Rhodopirellula sp. JB044 TaxID=3342844 RepID=UPI003709C6C7